MNLYKLPSNKLLKYRYTGKFKAPSPEWKHELFRLEDYELIVVTEGTLYLNYNGDDFTVREGEYLLLPPSKGWRQGFKEAYSAFYWMHFFNEGKNEEDFIVLPQTGKIPKIEKMVVLMKQLQDSVKLNYPEISLNAMTTSIVLELYGQLCKKEPLGTEKFIQKQFYSDVIDYIHLNQSKNIKVKDIADYFGYNEKYLSHVFMQNTGISLKQYILQQKIDASNYYLTDTNIQISEIAAALGFPDSNNFSRVYKKCTGLTPSQYRDTFSQRMLFDK